MMFSGGIMNEMLSIYDCIQFAIFNQLSYSFEETIGYDVKASFASRPEPRLTR